MSFPLDEVNETTPLEIFYARNPEELTDDELAALVQLHRDERAAHLLKKTRKTRAARKL